MSEKQDAAYRKAAIRASEILDARNPRTDGFRYITPGYLIRFRELTRLLVELGEDAVANMDFDRLTSRYSTPVAGMTEDAP